MTTERDSHDVLTSEEPLSTESLYDGEIVRALWTEAAERADTTQCAYDVWQLLTDAYDSTGNPKLYELKTAVDFFGIADFHNTSQGFRNEIHRRN